MKITLPFTKIVRKSEGFSPNKLNEIVREALEISRERPTYLEIADDTQQCFLFFRQSQIYSAGRILYGQLSETTIKDFLLTVNRMDVSTATCYEVNNKILHSVLILFQKKPTLKLLSSLVDLDQVLDKIEEEKKSCIVSASQDTFLAALRYEKGDVKALCHELSSSMPKEKTFRDDFLVRIYTLSAEKPLTINIYEDLLVKYVSDAKMIDDRYQGDITDLFLSKPPVVTLEFKGKEIGHWVLEKPVLKIGRTTDNDIVIDNLAVSRNHSVIEEDKGRYYIKDCDSLNGTLLNGHLVGRAMLSDGDEIQIGKHKLLFQKQSGREISLNPEIDTFDQTVIINRDKIAVRNTVEREPTCSSPRLIEKSGSGDRVFELDNSTLTLGKDENADVEIGGFLVARRHAEITSENGGFVIRHLNGYRKVTVEGRTIKECVLKDNDKIKIGSNVFVFCE
ncbi:MAG: FHA domain-containing protein [Candidatus Latescibacterota bacterium]|nr:MAG: FHA domain-containing protein [Candidatus Latescibacterota bacterium]